MAGDLSKFLITRLPPYRPHFYDAIIEWVAKHAPDLAPHFDFQPVPCPSPDPTATALHVAWLQDPVQYYNVPAYEASCKLADQCDELGIPIINRVTKLANAGKVEGSKRIQSAGFRTPKMALIDDPEDFHDSFLGFEFPFFVREDWSHNCDFRLAKTPEEARAIPLHKYRRPVVCEFIDVEDPDGLFRRYRCFVAGDICFPQGMLTCTRWKAKGESRMLDLEARELDLEYATGIEPNADKFLDASRRLELQWMAFDYSKIPGTGEVVVWEANPYPNIDSSVGERAYRRFVVDRVVSALLRLYLRTANLPVPSRIERLAMGD